DKLVARATAGQGGDDDEEGAEAPLVAGDSSASQELYQAAKQLRDDPTDMKADMALAEASAAVFAVDFLPELDDAQLAAVGRVTRRLLGALGADEALEAEISHEAEVLCRLIAPSAGSKAMAAEAARARGRLESAAKELGRPVELPESVVTPGGELAGTARPSSVEGVVDNIGAPSGAGDVVGTISSQPVASAIAETTSGHRAGGWESAGGGVEENDEEVEEGEEGTGEVVYELAEWLPEQRVELSLLLESAGIAYNWDGADLTVAEERETEIEGLFEQVHGLVDEDDEARYRSIEELFGSVDRLANDPSNEERRRAFLEAVGAVELPTPVGVDDAFWWRVRSQGHALVAGLEHGARVEEISREAALLAEMLHEMV
ncbi:MAG TPA: hypothetical protein VK425_06565, partial [Acidimicrobiales bacterium]|nr:hypothetical protein [Acidimicrobiales bacterium]